MSRNPGTEQPTAPPCAARPAPPRGRAMRRSTRTRTRERSVCPSTMTRLCSWICLALICLAAGGVSKHRVVSAPLRSVNLTSCSVFPCAQAGPQLLPGGQLDEQDMGELTIAPNPAAGPPDLTRGAVVDVLAPQFAPAVRVVHTPRRRRSARSSSSVLAAARGCWTSGSTRSSRPTARSTSRPPTSSGPSSSDWC